MQLYIKKITIIKNGKTESCELTPRLSVIRGGEELCGVIKLLLGREEAVTAPCDISFCAEVLLGGDRVPLEGEKCRGDSVYSLSENFVEYFDAVRQSEEMESALFFDRFKKQDYPHRLMRYKDIEKYYPNGEFLKVTDGYGLTRSFRAFTAQYIKDFEPIRLRPQKDLYLSLTKSGEFTVRHKDSADGVLLSETEDVLYHYLSFISIADFWDKAEALRNLNHVKKPLVITLFLEHLDSSVDTSAVLEKTASLPRQSIIFTNRKL